MNLLRQITYSYGAYENLSNLTYYCRLVSATVPDNMTIKSSKNLENANEAGELNSRSAKLKSKRLFHLSPQAVEYLRFLQFLNRYFDNYHIISFLEIL